MQAKLCRGSSERRWVYIPMGIELCMPINFYMFEKMKRGDN